MPLQWAALCIVLLSPSFAGELKPLPIKAPGTTEAELPADLKLPWAMAAKSAAESFAQFNFTLTDQQKTHQQAVLKFQNEQQSAFQKAAQWCEQHGRAVAQKPSGEPECGPGLQSKEKPPPLH